MPLDVRQPLQLFLVMDVGNNIFVSYSFNNQSPALPKSYD